MGTRKAQHKVGTPAKPRGQQTGFAGNPDQNREQMSKTPALRGRLKKAADLRHDHPNNLTCSQTDEQRVSALILAIETASASVG